MPVYITAYTTTDKVRAALGVTDNEMSDTMLQNYDLWTALLVDLASWLPNHEAIYETATGNPTPSEEVLGMLLQLYSQWFCAAKAVETWLALPQRISDGKADMRRFSALDLEQLTAMTQRRAAGYRETILTQITPTRTAGFGLAGAVSPAFDPVTNTTT